MESKILAKLGIDPAFIFLFMLILIVVLFVLYVNVSLKYDRLKNSYASFMRGKDGKNLEESILTKFSELDGIAKIIKQNRADVKEMYRRTEHCIQKCGIVKYDAFNEMGGKLSFALALLDSDNTGWILILMISSNNRIIPTAAAINSLVGSAANTASVIFLFLHICPRLYSF